MSQATETATDRTKERLQPLYEVHEELQLIAESDVPYARDAQNFLESLREAGYDV